MEENKETLVYTVDELAKVLKISKSNAYQLVRANDFPKIRLNKRILILASELKIWLQKKCNCNSYEIKKF